MRAEDIAMDIADSLHHGECLCYEEGFLSLMGDIEYLKEICIKEYEKNRGE